MDFLELKEQFENKLKGDFKFEILDLHYSPYAFGSGMTVYRIKGRIIKVMYDGRENEIELMTSKPHDKYPDTSWTTIFTGLPSDFIEKGVAKLNNLYGREVKQKYKTDFAVLAKLVNSFDPCGLIKGGAPSDEYDCLTQQILSSIYHKKTRQEIKKLIIYEVDHHFEMPVEEKYKAKFNDSIDKFLTTLEQTFNSTNAQQ